MSAPEHCETCGEQCPNWYADHDRWNFVTAQMLNGRASILCPTCFVTRWAQITGLTARWRLVPEDQRPDVPTAVGAMCSTPEDNTPPRARPPAFFRGRVRDTGGGIVTILVDRDTEQYPNIGTRLVCDELAS